MPTDRLLIKIEQIARLRVAGIKDVRIAALVNLTNSGLQRILATPDYQEHEAAVLAGTITKMDEALAGRVNEMKQEFAVGVPAAMRALLETVTQRRDLRARLAAASEILDRDPDRAFAKTRLGISEVAPGVTLPDTVLEIAAQAGATAVADLAKAAPQKKDVVN